MKDIEKYDELIAKFIYIIAIGALSGLLVLLYIAVMK
jgi:hypothetical protein